MKNLSLILFMSFFSFISINLKAQFTQQQAINLVLNQILDQELNKVDVYISQAPVSNQTTISLWDNTSVNLVYANNWICFVDDWPFANWAHQCRYIIIDAASGNYQIQNKKFYPFDLETSYTSISQMPRPTITNLPSQPDIITNKAEPNANLYAIIINGDSDTRFQNDASAIYCTLIDIYGYTKENIFVHAVSAFDMDGDDNPNNDFDYSSTKVSIEHTLEEMAGTTSTLSEIPKLNPDDQLFIFISSHGVRDDDDNSRILIPGAYPLYDYELADLVDNINCAQFICMVEACESGGFYDKLMNYDDATVLCKNRSVQTSSNIQLSWHEWWMTGGYYNEFVYYWTAAVRGIYPAAESPWTPVAVTGSRDFSSNIPSHPGDYDPDINEDGIVQMSEAFDYANYMDTWTDYGVIAPGPTSFGDLQEPDPDFEPEDPIVFTDVSFDDDVLSLGGICGRTDTWQTIENRNYMIGDTLELDNNLIIEAGATLYFGKDNADIIVTGSDVLTLENDITINGNATNDIIIEGEFEVGTGVVFNNIGSIELNNSNKDVLINDATFNTSKIKNNSKTLIISNSQFNNSGWIYSYNGNLTFSYNDFNNTGLAISTLNATDIATISDCSFNTTITLTAIDLWDYHQFSISNNTIDGYYNGMQIWNSGESSGNHIIVNNEITNSILSAITAYNSHSKLTLNNLHHNRYGIRLNNNCKTALNGNPSANINSQTQQISNNDSYELYASYGSFPWYMKYNVIIDNDNTGGASDALIYYTNGTKDAMKDVRYNCWGSSFNASSDLYPTGHYYYNPDWCPGDGGISIELAEELYTAAKEQLENNEYATAKSTFQVIIEQYPDTKFAAASMKDLYVVEKYLSEDYNSLKSYYENNPNIQSKESLSQLSEFIVNKCEIKLENWQSAIDHYEATILDPSSPEDSIFAIIDLGHLYYLMENSQSKASLGIGKLSEYKPKSIEAYEKNRDYLLSLLPFKNSSPDHDEKLVSERLLNQNIPNPFSKTTNIDISLEQAAKIQITISNLNGKTIRNLQFELEEGHHQIPVELNNEPSGIYYYSLYVDGVYCESKKMMLVK